jgi:signal transduction histidine kinase
MRSALIMIDPAKLRENSDPPPVLMQRVAVDDQTVASDASLKSIIRNAIDVQSPNLVLQVAPHHRRLEFDFTALSFSAPENVHFRYQLEGFDNDWIEGNAQRSVIYSRLAAGNYRFRVKACNSDGVWNESGATVALNVAPFFWQTWWFQCSALGAFAFVVAATVRYVSFRRLRMKLRLLQQETALEKERARLARDLHDDLGSRLTEIVLLSGLALEEGGTPEKAGERVEQIAATARTGIKSLDETVWAVNPRNDTLPHLIDYISGFAPRFLESAGIALRIDAADRLPPRVVSAETRHNVLLAVKEALNNVVRHAQAKEVWLRVSVDDERVRVAVEDNGRGFEKEPDDALADGLRNMRQRMQEIGGEVEIKSSPGAGTAIRFIFPWLRR